jgi:hypothetical protein
MPSLAVLDVAIGLIFIYLIASLISSAMNELIENKLKKRSKNLERGIQELIHQDGSTIVSDLYNHPLVSGLFKGTYAEAQRKGELPSYIPSRNFSLALMDVVARAATPAGAGAAAASGASNAMSPPSAGQTGNPLADLRAAAVNLASTNEKVSRALVTLIDAAGADASRARRNVEEWFDSSMDRVSGWYKRRSQKFLVVIGVLIAALGNIDSINIVNTLSKDPAKREALVAQAQQYAAKQTNPAGTPNVDDPTLKNIDKLGLPLGWSGTGANDPRSLPVDAGGLLLKVFGIALSALAISLGAPFWFDILNKVAVVRSTVKPSEKSPPEKSKD